MSDSYDHYDRGSAAVVQGLYGEILTLRAKRDALEAENERLLAALQLVLIGLCGVSDRPEYGDLESLRTFCRAALEGKSDDQDKKG